MNPTLKEVAFVFFKLGCFAFGGPAAHIAVMEYEVVEKRKWMSKEHFLDLIGATNLIPGPNSTEMTMHCGYERAGWHGLLVAGICFIFPAIVTTGFLGYLYVTYGHLPELQPVLYGIKPIVLALIASAIYKLGKKALKGWELGFLGVLVIGLSLLGFNEVYALLIGGVFGAFYFSFKNNIQKNLSVILPIPALQLGSLGIAKISTLQVGLTFLKVGSILYGSGYVLFAYLDAELVANGWMSRQALMDAIAIGQFTPGPVLSTATFVGFQLNGIYGALAATTGIFLPSFLFVIILTPLIPKMQKSKLLRGFLDSVNIAAVAIMLVVLFRMGAETVVDWQSILIALVGAIFTFGPMKLSPFWLVGIGIALGYGLSFLSN